MKAIHAVYENGVFRPTEPVDWPEQTRVVIELDSNQEPQRAPIDEVDEILSRRYRSGHHDTAARHNEHQP
ncbi:MAG: antitoxin family protein [Planctomycetaceae bacterium]|jgi:predicted DNA-binding antitoxin AbrB/MazE fold protein|nr:antitoxin family protein [Planctomycetaceae bacterium]